MRRIVLLPLALLGLATLGLASASALVSTKQANASANGTISRLSSDSIAISRRHGHGHRLTCRLASLSPGLTAFAVGDHVKIACADHVLVAIGDLPTRSLKGSSKHGGAANISATTTEPTVTSANGPITALDDGSVSVQTMRCTIGSTSPSTAGFSVGSPVRMYCVNGVLYALKHADAPPPTTTTTTTTPTTTTETHYTGISGTISNLATGSITVTSTGGSDDGPSVLTCTIGSSSPSVSGFSVGNLVRMYCANGGLYQLKHADTTPPATTTTTTTTTTAATTPQNWTAITGTVTSLSGASISVQGGDGGSASLTCTIGSSSPSPSGFSSGNLVRMYCLNGALYSLSHYPPPTTSTTTTTTTTTTTATTTSGDYATLDGSLTALSPGSISVSSSGSSLTCTIGGSSPSTSGYSVGNSVRMYCQAGALIYLRHL